MPLDDVRPTPLSRRNQSFRKIEGLPVLEAVNYVYPCCGLYAVALHGVKHQCCDCLLSPVRAEHIFMECQYCEKCHYKCGSLVEYVRHHDRAHRAVPVLICGLCRYPYVTGAALKFHINQFHGGVGAFDMEYNSRYCQQASTTVETVELGSV